MSLALTGDRIRASRRFSGPKLREHVGGLIIVSYGARNAMFYRGRRYRCFVNGVELPCRRAGHVASVAMAAYVGGVTFKHEEIR